LIRSSKVSLSTGPDAVDGADAVEELAHRLHVASLVFGLHRGVELGVDVLHAVDELGGEHHGALLAVEDLREVEGHELLSQLLPLLGGEPGHVAAAERALPLEDAAVVTVGHLTGPVDVGHAPLRLLRGGEDPLERRDLVLVVGAQRIAHARSIGGVGRSSLLARAHGVRTSAVSRACQRVRRT
jgi:hypothetical protein